MDNSVGEPKHAQPLRPEPAEVMEVTAAEFRETFGEDLRVALDINGWKPGDLSQEYRRIEREVHEAVDRETGLQREIRRRIFPALKRQPATRPLGVFPADKQEIASLHADLLFCGGVEGCDGHIQVHDSLPLTIYQMGVSLVSYQGNQASWSQRLFRRDLRQKGLDPIDEVFEILERRARREAAHGPNGTDRLGELAQRAILAYAERAILLHRSEAPWRLGHGNPVPYELLTGGGNLEVMVEATRVLRALIEDHQKFLFVASEPHERMLLTIGHALQPLEFALVGTLDEWLIGWLQQKRFKVGVSALLDWDGQKIQAKEWIPRFIERVASQVIVGLYRATALAPAKLFYAHVDHAEDAAHVALADSVLQEHKGFPLLVDLAGQVCRMVFGGTLENLTQNAYAAAGAPWLYTGEQP